MTTFDPTKPVQTRDGRRARLGVDRARRRDGSEYAVAFVELPSGGEDCYAVNPKTGKHGSGYPGPHATIDDLVNVVEPHVRWVNYYDSTSPTAYHESRRDADDYALARLKQLNSRRVSCVRVEFTEGEGL